MEKLGFQKIKDNIKEQSGDQDRNLIKKNNNKMLKLEMQE